jgi:hypothetical protein
MAKQAIVKYEFNVIVVFTKEIYREFEDKSFCLPEIFEVVNLT